MVHENGSFLMEFFFHYQARERFFPTGEESHSKATTKENGNLGLEKKDGSKEVSCLETSNSLIVLSLLGKSLSTYCE